MSVNPSCLSGRSTQAHVIGAAAAIMCGLLAGALQAQDVSAGAVPGSADTVMVPGLQLEGPHVFKRAQGYSLMETVQREGVWHVRTTSVPAEPLPRITVRVDNPNQTTFEVVLRKDPAPSPAEIDGNPKRLLMLSDLEGQFDKFVALLQANDVIDTNMHWQYGQDHIALVGDMVDRGEHATALLWLIYRLDAEATAAGGGLHLVLGNHEQMLLSGRSKYWAPRQVAFATALGTQGARQLYGSKSVLGAWLASKPVIARIGDHLLVHGGISQAFLSAGLGIEAANRVARSSLFTDLQFLSPEAATVLGEQGVTWYRGMALPNDPMYVRESDPKAHLSAVLAHFGAKRLAIGHTIVPHIVSEQDGLLLRLDIDHAALMPEAALYEQGILSRVDAAGGRTPFVVDSRLPD